MNNKNYEKKLKIYKSRKNEWFIANIIYGIYWFIELFFAIVEMDINSYGLTLPRVFLLLIITLLPGLLLVASAFISRKNILISSIITIASLIFLNFFGGIISVIINFIYIIYGIILIKSYFEFENNKE